MKVWALGILALFACLNGMAEAPANTEVNTMSSLDRGNEGVVHPSHLSVPSNEYSPSELKKEGFTPAVLCRTNGNCQGQTVAQVRAAENNPIVICKSPQDCQGVKPEVLHKRGLVPVVICKNCNAKEASQLKAQQVIPVVLCTPHGHCDNISLTTILKNNMEGLVICESPKLCGKKF